MNPEETTVTPLGSDCVIMTSTACWGQGVQEGVKPTANHGADPPQAHHRSAAAESVPW